MQQLYAANPNSQQLAGLYQAMTSLCPTTGNMIGPDDSKTEGITYSDHSSSSASIEDAGQNKSSNNTASNGMKTLLTTMGTSPKSPSSNSVRNHHNGQKLLLASLFINIIISFSPSY